MSEKCVCELTEQPFYDDEICDDCSDYSLEDETEPTTRCKHALNVNEWKARKIIEEGFDLRGAPTIEEHRGEFFVVGYNCLESCPDFDEAQETLKKELEDWKGKDEVQEPGTYFTLCGPPRIEERDGEFLVVGYNCFMECVDREEAQQVLRDERAAWRSRQGAAKGIHAARLREQGVREATASQLAHLIGVLTWELHECAKNKGFDGLCYDNEGRSNCDLSGSCDEFKMWCEVRADMRGSAGKLREWAKAKGVGTREYYARLEAEGDE